MQLTVLIVLSVLCIQTPVIAQPPKLVPRAVLPGEGLEGGFWLAAPYIAVVKVKAAELIGAKIEVTPGFLVVRMVRVDAEVENVFQGELPKGPVQFYFFMNDPTEYGYRTELSWLSPGHRYVVFLRKDGGVLRTMADVAEVSIPVMSGKHDQIRIAESPPGEHYPGKEIAYVALTPTSSYDAGFARGLLAIHNVLHGFSPRGYVLHLLRELLESADESIREWACLALSEGFNYQDPCTSKLSESKEFEVRQLASRFRRVGLSGQRRIIKVLRDEPFSLSSRVEDLDGSLEAFTYDSDPAVRQQACTTLRRLFQSRDSQNCAALPASKR